MMSSAESSPSLLAHGAAGSASSVFALSLLYPLDQLRTLQQLGLAPRVASTPSKELYGEKLGCLVDCLKQQGVHGMYRGLTPSLFALGLSNFLFYFCFHGLRKLIKFLLALRAQSRPAGGVGGAFAGQKNIEDLLTSTIAGVVTVLMTNPLWLAATRMKYGQQQQSSSSSPASLSAVDTAPDEGRRGQEGGSTPAPQPPPPVRGSPETESPEEASSPQDQGGPPSTSTFTSTSLRAYTEEGGGCRGGGADMCPENSPPPPLEEDAAPSSPTTTATGAQLPPPPSSETAAAGVLGGDSKREKSANLSGVLGLVALLLKVRREEGLKGLWKGTGASLVLVSNPAIHFAVYEGVKRVLLNSNQAATLAAATTAAAGAAAAAQAGPPLASCDASSWQGVVPAAFSSAVAAAASVSALSPLQGFLVGGCAKAAATVATYPLQMAQARLRSGCEADGANTFTCLARVLRDDGVAGLFQGFEAKIVQSVLTSALVFGSYETILGTFYSGANKK
mmetsp:Transcript_37991/g.75120  ORF Transcript_37991/g.75120 Transcript_37991/m.75120 type:complete len:506 (+) Transcript_37991:39-1556(+)